METKGMFQPDAITFELIKLLILLPQMKEMLDSTGFVDVKESVVLLLCLIQ
jgi:hypothetical protein